MPIDQSIDLQPSKITRRSQYQRCRDWLRLAAVGSITGLPGAPAAGAPQVDEANTTLGARRLGAKRWMALHRPGYRIAPPGILHFWWTPKWEIAGPALDAAVRKTQKRSSTIQYVT